MKKTSLKHILASFCVLAMLGGILPASAAAMDFGAYQAAVAEYQAAINAQLQIQQQAEQEIMQAYLEAQFFDVEAAYRRLVSCKNGDEREKYFFSLNEYQRFRLVEYLGKMVELGYFRGFDDFDIPGLELNGTEEEKAEKKANLEASEEERFLTLYAPYIELYKLYGSSADYSGISREAYLKIQEIVDGRSSETPKEENAEVTEDNSAVDDTVDPNKGEIVNNDVEVSDESEVTADDAEIPETPSEADLFYSDYENYINLYKEFGKYADLSGIPFEVQEQIKAMFEASSDGENSTAEDESVDGDKVLKESEAAILSGSENSDGADVIDDTEAEDVDTENVSDDTESTDDIDEPAADDSEEKEESPAVTEAEDLGEKEDEDLNDNLSETEDIVSNGDENFDETEAENPARENASDETESTDNIDEPAADDSEEEEESPAVTEAEDLIERTEESPVEDIDIVEKDLPSDPVIPAAADAPAPEPKAVTILSSLGDDVSLGAPVTLTGVLEDAEEFTDIIYIWEVDKGNGYEPVPDADGPAYTFHATVESLSWNWRLSVYYK